jgi:hypothetical protein
MSDYEELTSIIKSELKGYFDDLGKTMPSISYAK